MPVTRTYGCPDCGNTFSFLHLNADEPPPDYCAKCGSFMGDDPTPLPAAPAIIGPKAKSIDETYRQLEESSAARAEAAGDPSLKITDLKDNLREGDVAAVAPNNPVTQYAAESGHQFFQGQTVGAYVHDAQNGPARSTGAVALEAIQGAPLKRAPSVPQASIAGMKAGWGGGG